MAQLELPRLVLRHRHQDELVNAVLLTLLRMVWDLQQQQQTHRLETEKEDEDSIDSGDDDDDTDFDEGRREEDIPQLSGDVQPLSNEEIEALTEELVVTGFLDEWGGLVEGISALDKLYGPNHALLQFDDETIGFGTHDGVWQHSGWKVLTQLQQDQLASMPELKQLLNQIGRRSTTEQSDAINRFVPRRLDPDGGLGAQLDTQQRRESITGLTQSSNLSEMLPSEAVLFKSSSPALRRLFLAKKVESKLLSYQYSGWYDTASTPRTDQRHLLRNTPSAPGGPVIVCLDTSWSMTGGVRERLSKAVVVAAVSAAHKQKRECQVVAFSTATGVMETGLLTADAAGVNRLLDFLSHSFGGGTDVTGALKHAMQTLGSSDDHIMAAADLLLVTDGEIPDPPVPPVMMDDLDRLKRRTGTEIHGLLVGKEESLPMSKLCTATHDFLYEYDFMATVAANTGFSSSSSRGPAAFRCCRSQDHTNSGTGRPRWSPTCRPRVGFLHQRRWPGSSTRLFATTRDDDAVLLKKRVRNRESQFRDGSRGRFDDDDDLWEMDDSNSFDERWEVDTDVDNIRGGDVASSESSDSYGSKIDEGFNNLKAAVEADLKEKAWKAEDLDIEKNTESSCWKYRSELESAVEKVGENLVERDEESRLVVLALLAKEHLLLLGPPGTAKSALGRRLSKLCGGIFFQRLLTRFTTPEEIFGPLSLRALENDEYRRCTEGFLPTASVAFLDEIFKANSAILNTLLTILNERQFDNGAGRREDCRIRCVVGASNEMPESDELDALYDRFLLRKEVLPISDDGIMVILSMPSPGASSCDDGDAGSEAAACDLIFSQGLDQVVNELSVAAESVTMTDDACVLIRDLRKFMKEELNVDVSDRRLVKAGRLLKISACSHGRTRVDPIDCLLLQHVAWRLPEQRAAIRDWLWENVTPGGVSATAAVAQFRLLLNNLRDEAVTAVRKTSGDVTGSMGAFDSDIAGIRALVKEVSSVASILLERSTTMQRHMELLRRSTAHLWLSADEGRAAQQILLPKAASFLLEIDRALVDACRLEAVLRDGNLVENEVRVDIMEMLWNEGQETEIDFSDDELDISMREAKAKYDIETFRKWKRARKKTNKA